MANTSRSEWPRVNVNQFSLPRYASLQNRPLYESSRLGPRLLSACPRVAASLSTSQFSPRGTTCSELRLLFITVCIGEYFILASETALKNTFLCTEFVARGNFGSLQHRHRYCAARSFGFKSFRDRDCRLLSALRNNRFGPVVRFFFEG